MNIETIDLYKYSDKDRGNANGGYLTVYARTESKEIKTRKRPAILVIPGGGYSIVSDREGEPVALKYIDSGFVSFVLSYSVQTPYPTPLVEAMLAVMYIRDNADKYCIDKKKVCAIGFSAGGHLAGLLATVKPSEASMVNNDIAYVIPDAVILSYPVVTMGEYTHEGTRSVITGGDEMLRKNLSIDKRVDKNAVPAFIWHTYNDNCVPVENSLMLAQAYRKNKIPFALHIFEHGGHGLSLADDEVCDFTEHQQNLYKVGKWFDLSVDWLRAKGFKVIVK
ncbi:MAG: alpha/beta hydrolase [Clostridiales bacterium]|nr:alpha/beta hydrolase [Clostridiales bacterium]